MLVPLLLLPLLPADATTIFVVGTELVAVLLLLLLLLLLLWPF